MENGEPILSGTCLRAGVWQGELRSPDGRAHLPPVEVVHLDTPLSGVTVTPDAGRPGRWEIRVTIPPALLSEGVMTFLVRNAESGAKLGAFTIVAGEVLEDDLRAEIDLLRAELDMLKKAFRRHCLETGGPAAG